MDYDKINNPFLDCVPIPIFEEDLSKLKIKIDDIKIQEGIDFQKIINSRSNLVIELAGLVKVINVNKPALHLFKAKSKNDFYSSFHKITAYESSIYFIDIITAIANGWTRLHYKKICQNLNGDNIYINFHWEVFPGYENTYGRILICMEDKTDYNLMKQELFFSKQKADTDIRTKYLFLANMSHEIRTPLNGIMGMMQLLMTTPLSEEQSQWVRLAIISSNRLAQLFTDLLMLSEIEADLVDIVNEELCLEGLRDFIFELFASAANDKGVIFEGFIDHSIPRKLMGSALQLKQVLFYLVGNALKFTENGKVKLEMVPLQSLQSQSEYRVLFSISDTGIGIPETKMGFICEPFYQVDSTYTRKYQGAGLGLSIARGLIEKMGGNIYIASCLGKGTDINFTVPFKLADKIGQGGKRPPHQDTGTFSSCDALIVNPSHRVCPWP